jgi:hypothetical protein
MGIDASALLGAAQIAGVKVMPRGATMGRAINQGGMSVGGLVGAAGGAARRLSDGRTGSYGFCQTDMCDVLSWLNGRRCQSAHRAARRRPASRAMRSSSAGHT